MMTLKNDIIMHSYCTCNINSVTTDDDECTHHETLSACYQLAQSILNTGLALAKKGGIGEVGGHSHDMLSTWQLSWMAVEKPWSALAV